jgi:hypothetical protein
MNPKFWAKFIERAWLVFLGAGLVVAFVAVFGKSPIGSYEVQNTSLQLPLLFFSVVLVLASLAMVTKEQFFPTPVPRDPADPPPPFDPEDYELRVRTQSGYTVSSPLEIVGNIAEQLPEGWEVWLFNQAWVEGQYWYWPQERVDVRQDRTWTFSYNTKFKENEKREIRFYYVGPDGQKLIGCFRRVNERQIAKFEGPEKPRYEAFTTLVSDIFPASTPLLFTLTTEPGKVPPVSRR